MAEKVIISKRWQLSLRDWFKAIASTIIVPMLFEVQKTLDTGSLDINWKQVAMIGLGAGVAYIAKQLIGSPKVTTVYSTNEKAEAVAEDIESKN